MRMVGADWTETMLWPCWVAVATTTPSMGATMVGAQLAEKPKNAATASTRVTLGQVELRADAYRCRRDLRQPHFPWSLCPYSSN